jgi:hypothetical protein
MSTTSILDRRGDEQAADRGQLVVQSREAHGVEQRRAPVHTDDEEPQVLVVVLFFPLNTREKKNIQPKEPNETCYRS